MADGKKKPWYEALADFAGKFGNDAVDVGKTTVKGGAWGAGIGLGLAGLVGGGVAGTIATVLGKAGLLAAGVGGAAVAGPFIGLAVVAGVCAPLFGKKIGALAAVAAGIFAVSVGWIAAPIAICAAIGAAIFGSVAEKGLKHGAIAGGALSGGRSIWSRLFGKKSDPAAAQAAAQETAQAITKAAETTPAVAQDTEQKVEANMKPPAGTTVAVVATLAELLKDSKITALETAGNKQEAAVFQIAAMEFLANNYPHSAEAKAALEASIASLKTANGLDVKAAIAPAMKAEEFVNISIPDIQLIIERLPEAHQAKVQTAMELHMTDAGIDRLKAHRDAVAKFRAKAAAKSAVAPVVTVAPEESLPIAAGASAADMARANKVMDVVKNASILSKDSGVTDADKKTAAQALIAGLAHLEGKSPKDIAEMKDGAQELIDKYRAENRENLAAKGAALMGMNMVQYNGGGELGSGRANTITTRVNSGELAMVTN